MSEWKPRVFWKEVSVDEVPGGFTVRLDGRQVKTPAKADLVVPTQAMADLVAAEWAGQTEVVDPETMPATRAANAAIDRVSIKHAEVADMLAEYGDSDLLCYRAEAPAELVARQAAIWDPLLDWAAETYDARLEPRSGIMHASQSKASLDALRNEVHRLSAFQLTAFHDLVTLSGSLILGLAAAKDMQPIDDLWSAARIDETWQEEQWGEDEEASATAAIKRESFVRAKELFDVVTITY
jgi:chaperone required for assembly of F1-ATPase